jgi:ABC-type multidrug transport system ATPase subunit
MTIKFEQCSFSYKGGTKVLNGLSLEFPPGSTVLLGPNGAGKSTLLTLAASVIRPDSGKVSLRAINPASRGQRTTYRQAVGWMPQKIQSVPGLTVREQVAYAGWLKRLSRSTAWERSIVALQRVGLAQLADRKSHALSGGQLRRMGLAQTLVHHAEIVLMDEPTAGLDPSQQETFRELIEQLSQDTHVVVSTHQIGDISDVYDSVIVLDRGSVRFQGSIEDFLRTVTDNGGDRAADAYRRFVSREI